MNVHSALIHINIYDQMYINTFNKLNVQFLIFNYVKGKQQQILDCSFSYKQCGNQRDFVSIMKTNISVICIQINDYIMMIQFVMSFNSKLWHLVVFLVQIYLKIPETNYCLNKLVQIFGQISKLIIADKDQNSQKDIILMILVSNPICDIKNVRLISHNLIIYGLSCNPNKYRRLQGLS
ncbi:unnamed protein product [Paramecium octaurelia]|uniref:Uncharacterized protein n=1 Tax=Paramecium octaurelia TaxID=43137 RepID=A0A8S1YLV8_PAROT|nr:unnamed protein product [Paramecium octaurelia]